MEKNLTTGSVLKSILYFSLPYLLSYFLQTLYGMADLFIIGQFEDISSITAVSGRPRGPGDGCRSDGFRLDPGGSQGHGSR